MTNLKTAAHNLLTTLQAAAKKPDDVKVAIVPFATDVNAGTANVSASWIDWTDWEAANGTCSNTSYSSKSSCQSHGKVWTPAAHSTWNGCVYDRDQNNDVANTATDGGRAGDAVPRPSGRQLPGRDDAAQQRLDRAQRQDRRDDPGRQHQRHHRPGLGLSVALAGRSRSTRRRRRPISTR